MDVSLSELWELAMDREAWRAVIHKESGTNERLNWTEQEAVNNTIPKKKKCKKAKWLSQEALQIEKKGKTKEKMKDVLIRMQSSKE